MIWAVPAAVGASSKEITAGVSGRRAVARTDTPVRARRTAGEVPTDRSRGTAMVSATAVAAVATTGPLSVRVVAAVGVGVATCLPGEIAPSATL